MASTTKHVLLVSDNSDQIEEWQLLTKRALLELDDSKCEISQATDISEALAHLSSSSRTSGSQFSIILVGQTEAISLLKIATLIRQTPAANYVVIPLSEGIDHEAELELIAIGAHAVERELTIEKLQIALASSSKMASLREQAQRHIEFSRIVSHDLKGPLNQLLQFCNLLRADVNATPNERKVWMDFVISNSNRLTHLVNDLDRFFRSQSPHMETQKCEMADVMDMALDTISTSPSDIIVEEPPASIVVDGNMSLLSISLRQIILHRLESSVCESPTVTIACKVQDDRCLINIRDNGVPVDGNETERLFEPFSQTSSGLLPSGQRWSGLEMASGKRIVEEHGGEIEFSSDTNSGNCITVSLPLCV